MKNYLNATGSRLGQVGMTLRHFCCAAAATPESDSSQSAWEKNDVLAKQSFPINDNKPQSVLILLTHTKHTIYRTGHSVSRRVLRSCETKRQLGETKGQ